MAGDYGEAAEYNVELCRDECADAYTDRADRNVR